MSEAPTQKVELELPADVLDYLDEQARARNMTPAEVILSALGSDKFLRSKTESANSEVLVRENGVTQKVKFAG